MTNYQIESREWWVQRWLELLDSYRFKKRLERARNYAREGNVLDISFEAAQVLAKVQGTESEPYQVSLSLEPFRDEDWGFVLETLSQKAIYSAQLLAGQMPDDIEAVFTANGLNLFPFSLGDINSHCSCPDKANPCKHIGAVYYQLGDRFSEDPFVIFQLRGRSKTDILQGLHELRIQEAATANGEDATTVEVKEKKAEQETTTIDLTNFWRYDQPLESSLVVIVPPTDTKTVLDVLGRILLAYADAEMVEQFLEQVYQNVSQQAIIAALEE